MVWGMNRPPVSNGPYYLAGEFEGAAPVASNGWYKRLSRHFIDEMPQVQQDIFQDKNNAGAHWYACHAIGKFSIRREWRGRELGLDQAAILDHEIPAFFQSTGNFNKLASMAQFAGPVLTVNQVLRDLIEWVEPGVHGLYHRSRLADGMAWNTASSFVERVGFPDARKRRRTAGAAVQRFGSERR